MAPKRALSVAVGGDGGAPPPPLPPEKRQRAGAGPAPSRSSPELLPPPPSPSPKHFLAIVLVVLFLKRPKGRSTGRAVPFSLSQMGRVVRDQICRFINPMFSKLEKVEAKLERIEERIQDLTVKVDNITRSSPNLRNDEQFTQEENHEGTSAEPAGLATAQGNCENTSIRLRFLNGLKTPVYHDDEIKSESNTAIKIGIFNGDKMIESGGLSNLQIEIFALEGDFPHASPKSWTPKKFNKHRAHSRDGNRNVLAGEGTKAQLKNGKCDLGSLKFTEGPCKARGGKFIIGARVCEGEVSGGLQVQQAVMNPVVVQDRRNKSNEKSHPPKLNDSVHRLEEIAKVYAERLEKENIITVEDFLRALNEDPCNLAKILKVNKEHKPWKKMTKHARECSLEGRHKLKLFICSEKNVKLFFNCVHCLVGAEFFCGPYTLTDNFSFAQQELVDQLKKVAYAKLVKLPEDHVMTDNSPNPIHVDKYTSISAGPSYMPSEQPNCSVPLASVQAAAERLSHDQIESFSVITYNDPVPTSIPDHHSIHTYQGGGIPVPPLEGLSHDDQHNELLSANANNNDPGPSSSTADHFCTYNCRGVADQGNPLAGQGQFLAFVNSRCQDPLGGASNICPFVFPKDAGSAFLQCEADINTYGTPGLDHVEIQSQLLMLRNGNLDGSTSGYMNIALPPHKPIIPGTPRSAQGSTQRQMQTSLPPTNDASVASASTQQPLPPQQPCYPWDGPW